MDDRQICRIQDNHSEKPSYTDSSRDSYYLVVESKHSSETRFPSWEKEDAWQGQEVSPIVEEPVSHKEEDEQEYSYRIVSVEQGRSLSKLSHPIKTYQQVTQSCASETQG